MLLKNNKSQGFEIARRVRRNRRGAAIRGLTQETHLHKSDLVYPLFVEEGIKEPQAVEHLPETFRIPEDNLSDELAHLQELGITAVMLFGVPKKKDDEGSESFKDGGFLWRIVHTAKKAAPEMVIMADACFCAYTTHGHCGVLIGDELHNDLTLQNLQKQAVMVAEAGADYICPSAMMDGQVAAIRDALDEAGFDHVGIISYSSKFASSFYGPFRSASKCDVGEGDRKTYQLNPANSREALLESLIDEDEGADVLMVKPAVHYMDILSAVKNHTLKPLAAYHTSGECAMLHQAAKAGALDEESAVIETLLGLKRAGADIILTYYAPQMAKWLDKN